MTVRGFVLGILCHLATSLVFASAPEEGTFVNSLGMKLVRMEPGSFVMGSAEGGDFDERPVHKATISQPFHMAATEVTNQQYEEFDPGHRALRGKPGVSKEDDEAVIFVSWNEAAKFCEWLSKKEGKPYRLPTEAEWEYACRAGTTTAYWTGDTLPKGFWKNQKTSWFPDGDRGRKAEIVPLTVGKTPPNPWGLYDMHGNVEEWCHDSYGPYEAADQSDPVGRADGDFKVTRGGSHQTEIQYLRSANRSGALPEDKSWLIGFRVVLAELPKTAPVAVPRFPLNQQNVERAIAPDLVKGPDPNKPYFKGPRQYVKIPPNSNGPMFSAHNHDPAIVECPNGDLLAIWYTCVKEQGRELAILASRLRRGAAEWDAASPFWDAPDRNDHAPAMWADGKGTIYHFNGLSAAATWGNLALILRTSTDSGATWSRARLIASEHGLRHQCVESVIQAQDGSIILPCDAVTGGSGGTAIHISRDGGKTWTDPGETRPAPKFEAGQTGAWIAGIHAGVVQLKNGRLMAFGRGDSIDGKMPMSISSDMGQNWTYGASPFPPIGGGQRLVLTRLKEGPIFLASFAGEMKLKDAAGKERSVTGLYAALSFDEGQTWPLRRLITDDGPGRQAPTTDGRPFTLSATSAEPHGYLSVCRTPDGVIQLISSWNHYAFNLAWLKTAMPAEGRTP